VGSEMCIRDSIRRYIFIVEVDQRYPVSDLLIKDMPIGFLKKK